MNERKGPIRDLEVTNVEEHVVTSPEQQEITQKAVQHIEAAIDLVQQKMHSAQFERSALTKAFSFIKDKLLRRESADQTLHKQLTELRTLRDQVERDPSQATAAIERVNQQHGTELLVADHKTSTDIEQRATQLMDAAVRDGKKPIDMEQAIAMVNRDVAAEEEIMRDFFAAGDVMNAHGEAQAVAQEQSTKNYQERYAAAQAADTERANTWQERLQTELDLNDDFVREAVTSKDKKIVFRPVQLTEENQMIRDWFDAGSRRDIMIQRSMETSEASKVYQKEIARAIKSTKAQTMAFELFLSGRMALNKFTKTLEKIRKDLGPSLMVDYAARAGAEHAVTSDRILNRLRNTNRELAGYSNTELDLFRTADANGEGLTIITPDRNVIYLNSDTLAQNGIYADELEKIASATAEEMAEFMHYATEERKEA